MRNPSRFRAMIEIYTIAGQMKRMCKDIIDNTTSEDAFFRDEVEAIQVRIEHILYSSNMYARDEYDFGPNGMMFEYRLKTLIKQALQEMNSPKDTQE